MAECNEIIMSSIEQVVNIKGIAELLKKNEKVFLHDIVSLNHIKCTHLSTAI